MSRARSLLCSLHRASNTTRAMQADRTRDARILVREELNVDENVKLVHPRRPGEMRETAFVWFCLFFFSPLCFFFVDRGTFRTFCSSARALLLSAVAKTRLNLPCTRLVGVGTGSIPVESDRFESQVTVSFVFCALLGPTLHHTRLCSCLSS